MGAPGREPDSRSRATCKNDGTVISSPSFPVELVGLRNGDVLMLPAVWPVRLTPEQQRQLVERLLATGSGCDLPRVEA